MKKKLFYEKDGLDGYYCNVYLSDKKDKLVVELSNYYNLGKSIILTVNIDDIIDDKIITALLKYSSIKGYIYLYNKLSDDKKLLMELEDE